MSAPERHTLEPLPDFESEEVSLFVAQMDDQSRLLRDEFRGVTATELSRQPAPGTNTIGMLLTHMAITEVFWTSVLTESAFLCEQVLGLRSEDDGMPLAADGLPPAGLAGRELAFFDDLLARARHNTLRQMRPLVAADLTRPIEQRRRTGVVTLNGRWILYHMLEHTAGHRAQIALLGRLLRVRPAAA